MPPIIFIIDNSTLFFVNIVYNSERSCPERNKMPKSKEINIRLDIAPPPLFFLFQVPTYIPSSLITSSDNTNKKILGFLCLIASGVSNNS